MLALAGGVLLALGIGFALILFINKKITSKRQKLYTSISLWLLIALIFYGLGHSVYEPISFEKIKKERYKKVISRLEDIRTAQMAYKQVNGYYQSNFDSLIYFVENAQIPITQQRDTTILDEKLSKAYGVDHYKEIVLIDTIGYESIKAFYFKNSNRYTQMKYLPIEGLSNKTFQMESGFITTENGDEVPTFEVIIDKDLILYDQDAHLVEEEKQVISVNEINGTSIRLGSMSEIITTGNWPKTYSEK